MYLTIPKPETNFYVAQHGDHFAIFCDNVVLAEEIDDHKDFENVEIYFIAPGEWVWQGDNILIAESICRDCNENPKLMKFIR